MTVQGLFSCCERKSYRYGDAYTVLESYHVDSIEASKSSRIFKVFIQHSKTRYNRLEHLQATFVSTKA